MKADELMPGDWVRVNHDGLCIRKNSIVEVRGIDADDKLAEKGLIGSVHCRPLDDDQFEGGIWCEHLEPIPLTPEILEKNGFISGDFYAELLYKDWQIMSDCEHLAARCRDGWNFDIPCQFVHELQHALRLCGIEKEIEI